MGRALPRVVVVKRSTDYEALLARHATHGQAAFFLQTHGQDIDPVFDRHRRFLVALEQTTQAIPAKWRRSVVDRDDLDRFLFEPDDIVVALGQDGLVANLAKYLRGQPVLGVNPLPDSYDGILVSLATSNISDLLADANRERAEVESRTMVEAVLDDGQRLLAVNEIFVGHRTHQSARYRLCLEDRDERQSSSGLIVATGTGATGWARSIHLSRRSQTKLPDPVDPRLVFFVREAFPSKVTGTDICEGLLDRDQVVEVVSEMNQGGVIFGDGIEDDRLSFHWGQRVRLRRSETRLNLVIGC